MGKIVHIKKLYEPYDIQKDLRMDAIVIFVHNFSKSFEHHEKRQMNKKEVEFFMNIVYSNVIQMNNIDNGNEPEEKIDWNQTS